MARDDDDILRIALELQAEQEARQDQNEALKDLGVSQENLERATRLVRGQAMARQARWKRGVGLAALVIGGLVSWMLLAMLTPSPYAIDAGISSSDGHTKPRLTTAQAQGPLLFWAEVRDLESDAVFGLHVDWLAPDGVTLASCTDSRHHKREERLRFSCKVELTPPIPPGAWRVKFSLQNNKLGRMALPLRGAETPGELRVQISD